MCVCVCVLESMSERGGVQGEKEGARNRELKIS